MSLHLKKRGRFYRVRGTVRIGKGEPQRIDHSTRCTSHAEADAYRTKLEAETRAELLTGHKIGLRHLTFADAGLAYIAKSGVHRNDEWRLRELDKHMGGYAVQDAKEGWRVFREKRCVGLAPATVERFRSVAQAALNLLAEEHDLMAPKLPRIEFKNKRVRFLTIDEQEALLAAYVKHVRHIALFLCDMGARTQEALQLRWREVDFAMNTAFFSKTKNGESRTVPLSSKVRKALEGLMIELQPGPGDHVFLNRLGEPYADTRRYEFQGGNPLAKAHRTACRRANISDFRVHDWRHHWASWHVMHGTDLESLRTMGGWKSLAMVQRYVAVSGVHMQEVVARRDKKLGSLRAVGAETGK